MEVIKDFQPCPEKCGRESVLTVGTFDGVHTGHQAILRRVVEESQKRNIRSVVLTFERHPRAVIAPDQMPKLITTLDEKIELFEDFCIDSVYVLKFTETIAALNAEEFISSYLLDCLGMKKFIAGYDHGLGKNRSTSTDSLEDMALQKGFSIEIVPPAKKGGKIIKSSTIREFISSGDIQSASKALGRDYSFLGVVVPGRGIGKKLGFPTANVTLLHKDKIVPPNGVYTGWTIIDNVSQKKDAVITFGPSPTFNLTEELIEVHIPGFERDLYGKSIRIGLTGRIRGIEKFSTEPELIHQIKNDITQIEKYNHKLSKGE